MKLLIRAYFAFLRALAVLVGFRGERIWFVLTFYPEDTNAEA